MTVSGDDADIQCIIESLDWILLILVFVICAFSKSLILSNSSYIQALLLIE